MPFAAKIRGAHDGEIYSSGPSNACTRPIKSDFVKIYLRILLHGKQNGGTQDTASGVGIFVLVPTLHITVPLSRLLHV